MIEELDAAQSANLLGGLLSAAAIVVVGLLIDLAVLRPLRRRAAAHDQLFAEAIAGALGGQPTFWALFLISRLYAEELTGALTADFLRGATQVVAVTAVAVLIVRLLTNLVEIYLRHQQIGSISLLNNLLRFLAALAVGGTLLGFYGIPLGPLLTVVAGSSIGLTLALRDPLANLFAGLQIIASNRVRIGDYVRLSGGEEGTVTDIRWSDTYLEQLSNNVVVIPNALMTSSIVINFSRPQTELAVPVELLIGPHNDLAAVEQLLLAEAAAVLRETEGGVGDFEPLVRVLAVETHGTRVNVILRGRSYVDQFLLRHELLKRLQQRLPQLGVRPPTQLIELRDTAAREAAL
jgi:small-conductance mechanosensitive channel